MPSDGRLEPRFLDLIERNQGRIGRLCRAWSRTDADFEDLRSEVHLQLWRSLPGFDARAAEDTWLYRVALNTAMLFGRSERSRKQRIESFAQEPQRSSAPAVHERLEDRERVKCLTRAIGGLDPADRALVTLQLEGLPYRKIAKVTGLSESHVGVRLHRLKKQLVRLFGEKTEADHGRA